MKIMLESTSEITEVNGVQCRVWRGATEKGSPCVAMIALIGVPATDSEPNAAIEEFARDLVGATVQVVSIPNADPSAN